MKKYFFITGLLAMIFLWLGNVSFADCQSDFAWCIQACNQFITGSNYKVCTDACSTDKQQCETQSNRATCSNGTTKCETAAQCSCSNAICTCLTTEQLNAQNDETQIHVCESAVDWSLSSLQRTLCLCKVTPESLPNLTYLASYENAIDWKNCCVTESVKDQFNGVLPVCTNAQQGEWNACSPSKANAHVNGVGICVCNDWRTDVDGTCRGCSEPDVCCGTKLNTKIPFIGDCIETTTQNPNSTINETTAFPVLVTALVKILISVILIASFVLIVVAGVMIASARDDASQATAGKKMIIKVAVWLAILWASGVILRLINPNFFW